MSHEFIEVKTPIDDESSFWSHYRKDAVGRVIHYIHHITGVLRYAENAKFHLNGQITQGETEPFATYDFDNGYPYFKFENETFNQRQDKLLGLTKFNNKRSFVFQLRDIPISFQELIETISVEQKGFSAKIPFTPETTDRLLEFIKRRRDIFHHTENEIRDSVANIDSIHWKYSNEILILLEFSKYCLKHFSNDINFIK